MGGRWKASIAVAAVLATIPTSAASGQRRPAGQVGGHRLRGFQPVSMSFPSSRVGYLLGYAAAGRFGDRPKAGHVLAKTIDGGQSWHRVNAPHVASFGNDRDSIVRFVTPRVGAIFGRQLWITTDGARRWHNTHFAGRVLDVEGGDGRIWALARTCATCSATRLYSASLRHPHLHVVGNAPKFKHRDESFVAGGDTELYVQVIPRLARGLVWRSYYGRSWTRQRSPCRYGGSLAAWSPAGLAAVCNVELYGLGQEAKSSYVSFDGAHSWTPAADPSEFGYIASITAGSSDDWVLSLARGEFEVSVDEGRTWIPTGASRDVADGIGDTTFLDPTTVVAIPDYMPDRQFFRSIDGGLTWSVIRFPKWRD